MYSVSSCRTMKAKKSIGLTEQISQQCVVSAMSVHSLLFFISIFVAVGVVVRCANQFDENKSNCIVCDHVIKVAKVNLLEDTQCRHPPQQTLTKWEKCSKQKKNIKCVRKQLYTSVTYNIYWIIYYPISTHKTRTNLCIPI